MGTDMALILGGVRSVKNKRYCICFSFSRLKATCAHMAVSQAHHIPAQRLLEVAGGKGLD